MALTCSFSIFPKGRVHWSQGSEHADGVPKFSFLSVLKLELSASSRKGDNGSQISFLNTLSRHKNNNREVCVCVCVCVSVSLCVVGVQRLVFSFFAQENFTFLFT